jgi:ferric-dicitrate binding protein FerR (iron transport regulator)
MASTQGRFEVRKQEAVAMTQTMSRKGEPRFVSWALSGTVAAALALLSPQGHVLAETNGCNLVPDDREPSVKILRCGEDLTIRIAADTDYRVTEQQGQTLPKAAQLKSGALMVEFKPGARQRTFQILTPHSIAAVRGTSWAVEVTPEQSSTLAVSGSVRVTRANGSNAVTLQAGEGADVTAGTGPITVKRWGEKRVQALLARFAQ